MKAPTKAGQICQILSPMADENPEDVYLVAEDPEPFNLDDNIYVVNLRELQRNINSPLMVSQIPLPKSELNVIANNLEEYIKTWNER